MKTKRHIKEFAGRTLLATLLLLMAQGAKALDVTCGHATWYYSVSANNEVFIDKVTPEAGETSVTMPEIIKGYPVKYANNNLFQGKTQLMQITIKPALEGLSNTHAIGQYFFNGCTSLKNVIFRKLPASFNQHAFNGCTAGVTISFGDGSSVTRTDWENIPGVDNGACFSGCPYAWAMTTDGVIFYFHTDKWPTGLGYNDDQTGKGVLTFDGTLTVDGGYPKSGVYSVFEYKSAINTVIIESGVTTIEDNAFYGCSNLTNLWYIGSKAQWDNISFGENWKEDSGLLNSGIHYLAASGSGTSSDPYIITTEDQWNTLCKYYSEGRLAEGLYYQLGEDISVSTMLGTADRPFVGTFDGSGHTLTFTLDTTEPFAALFRYINGATIQNLRTSGTITTSAKFASGLVSYSKGTNTITNCRSDISINSSVSGDGTHGGFVANINYGYVAIEGCVFNGTMKGTNTTSCGGFVGWTECNTNTSLSIRNSLFAPAELTIQGAQTFTRYRNANGVTINNCYYTQTFGAAQGTLAYAHAELPHGMSMGDKVADYGWSTAYTNGIWFDDVYYNKTPPTAYAIWCADNKTLYFTYVFETLTQGDYYEGHSITNVWSGDDVVNYNPDAAVKWYPDCHATVEKVVFNPNFQGVRVTSCANWFFDMKVLKTITGIEYLNTSQVTHMQCMFCGCESLESLDVNNFVTSNVTSMAYMFANCSSLTSLDLSHFNTSKVTTMQCMFYECTQLKELDLSNFESSSSNNTSWMFYGCSSLERIFCANTWSSSDSEDMFSGCTNIVGGNGTTLDASHLDIAYAHPDGPSNKGYFSCWSAYVLKCESTKTLYFTRSLATYAVDDEYEGAAITELWKDEAVTATGEGFPGWANWISNNIEKVVIEPSFKNVDISSCYVWFGGMTNLTDISGLEYLNTSNVTSMAYMFAGCESLTSLDVSNFDTSKVTDMQNMFLGCSQLKRIYCDDTWTCTSSEDMFLNCSSLVGGNGTTYDSSHVDATYARPDETDIPGYFSSQTQVLWCVGDSTLYFIKSLTPYAAGNQYNGQTVTDVWSGAKVTETGTAQPWVSYRGSVKKVVFDESFKDVRPTSCHAWFKEMNNLTSISGIEYLNTSNVTDMKDMFLGCSGLTTLDVSHFNTENVTDMHAMFYNCSGLTSLDVSHFNTAKVTDMNGMFSGCSGLKSLDVSQFNTEKVTDMSCMFSWCTGLTTILCNDTWSCSQSGNMFKGCSSLVGEYGKTYNENNIDATYANPGENGYFTLTEETIDATKVGDAHWTTYYNGYVACQADDRTTVYVATMGNKNKYMTITEVTDGIINKGQAVVLKSTQPTITLTRTLTAGTGADLDNVLKGVNKETTTPTDEGTIYTMTAKDGAPGFAPHTDSTIAARKAYLALADGTIAWLPLLLEGEEPAIPTDINEELRENLEEPADAVWYDLSGRKINGKPAKKGIYILNGKKTVVK